MKKTISDVAQELGVSVSTVSKVINNRTGVGAELRQRIADYVKEVDYKPNTIAQSMIKGRTNTVGLVFGDVRNPFYSDLMYSIQHRLAENGFIVMAFNSDYDTEKEVEFIDQAIQARYAGLFLITATGDELNKAIGDINAAKIPLVLINRTLKNYGGDFVSTDNFQAGYMATKHLIELGHTRLAFVSGNMDSSAGHQRYIGFRQAMSNYNLDFDDIMQFYPGDLRFETGVKIAEQYLQNLESNPTGLVISNDLMALGFIDYARKHGVKIPEQLSIVSFDNILFSSLYGMELTTVDQHREQMCACAVEMLLRQIEQPESPEVSRTMIEPTLVIRNTTGPCLRKSTF